MADLNKVILMGHMTADPELKQTGSGISVCSFSIGVNRRYSKSADQNQQSVDFINIVAWRQQAEFVSRYFKKGSSIIVCGQLQTRNWEDKQTGQKRYATEVIADEVSFGAPAANQNAGADRPAAQGYTPTAYGAPSFNSASSASFEEIPSDDSLPF